MQQNRMLYCQAVDMYWSAKCQGWLRPSVSNTRPASSCYYVCLWSYSSARTWPASVSNKFWWRICLWFGLKPGVNKFSKNL